MNENLNAAPNLNNQDPHYPDLPHKHAKALHRQPMGGKAASQGPVLQPGEKAPKNLATATRHTTKHSKAPQAIDSLAARLNPIG